MPEKPLKNFLFCLFCLSAFVLHGQDRFTISGYLTDAATGEQLIGANIYDARSEKGTSTNTYGFFSLTLPADSVHLLFSYIGYQARTEAFLLTENRVMEVALEPAATLETIEVVAERLDRVEEQTQMSQVDVPVEQIKKIPALLGEVDVLKALQLLPGVQSGGEGQNGLYVRGGSPDQNLILLDGVPVYNVSHVLGIFSVFNADAIKNVTLTKGGFPARYGGRLSSVLEINMKEGNSKEWHGEGAVGTIMSRLTVEGPLNKDKTSLLISGRRTYVDLLMAPFIALAQSDTEEKVKLRLYFYDLNAKLNHRFNDKHRLYFSAYAGADVFGSTLEDPDGSRFEGGTDWGNIIAATRWNFQLTDKLFKNTTLTYSRYNIDVNSAFEEMDEDVRESFRAKYFSGIEDVGLKTDFDFVPNPDHYVRFGAAITHHTYRPGALSLGFSAEDFDLDTLIGSQNDYSLELGLYAEDELTLGRLKANIGFHASAFHVDNSWYTSLQPRVGLNYRLQNGWALKASGSTMTQFINLLTSEALSLPTDLWVPSTARIKPQQSWQVAAGVARTFFDQLEFTLEGYYKQMDNVLSFREGASFLFGLENDWQDKVTQGTGESYGLEFFLQKKKGRMTGWLGYTLSWNWRQFDEINNGRQFPFRYDRRHDVSLVLSYDISEKIQANASWVYGTGNAVTLPVYQYPVADPTTEYSFFDPRVTNVESLGNKNAFRMSNYHRLDLSIAFRKKRPKWESQWVIGVYNVYNHNNPYFIIPDRETVYDANGQLISDKKVFKEISLLPFIPSVSYQFKF